MAGRKHHLQQVGYAGVNLNKIEDPIERDFAFRTIQVTPYCKHCGEQIVQSFQDKDGKSIDAEWEQKNQAHYSCHAEWLHETQAKARWEAEREKIAAANFNWNKYIQDMMNKKDD